MKAGVIGVCVRETERNKEESARFFSFFGWGAERGLWL